MSLIATSLFKNLADRAAQQGVLIQAGFNNAIASGLKYYPRVHEGVAADGDYDVENALITSANGIDQNTFSGTFFKNVFTSFFNDLDTHVQDNGAISFDSYLNISGINVHPTFEDEWFRVKGTHLSARNVFFIDPNIILGTYYATGSGTGVFTAGTTVGTGTGSASPTNHAAAKCVLIPINTLTAEAQVNVRLTREQPTDGNQAAFANIRLANGTLSGNQTMLPVDLGNIASGFLSVSNIVVAGSTSGNAFFVAALRERDISL